MSVPATNMTETNARKGHLQDTVDVERGLVILRTLLAQTEKHTIWTPDSLVSYSWSRQRERVGRDEVRTPEHADDNPISEMVPVVDNIDAIEVIIHLCDFSSVSARHRKSVKGGRAHRLGSRGREFIAHVLLHEARRLSRTLIETDIFNEDCGKAKNSIATVLI
jgi:hypothetical protein